MVEDSEEGVHVSLQVEFWVLNHRFAEYIMYLLSIIFQNRVLV